MPCCVPVEQQLVSVVLASVHSAENSGIPAYAAAPSRDAFRSAEQHSG